MNELRKDGYLKRPARPLTKTSCLNCNAILLSTKRTGKRFCDVKCRCQWGKFNEEPNTTCEQCSVPFWVFPHVLSEGHTGNTAGRYCSVECYADSKAGKAPVNKNGELIRKIETSGLNKRGYLLAPKGIRTNHPSEHNRIVCEYFNVDCLPKDLHIHHRDLNKTCNNLSNLAVLTGTDHRWLHAKAGDFGLKQFAAGACTAESIAATCDDPARLLRLINKCVLTQKIEDIENYDP